MKTIKTAMLSVGALLLMSTLAFAQSTGSGGSGAPATGGTPAAGSGSTSTTVERDIDLPMTAPPVATPKPQPPAPPTPPPTPTPTTPDPTTPPPTIYGKDLTSENGTVYYVIDISGSMGWDMGQYTAPDGSTQTGDRLQRAQAELTKSVTSLPSSFKFNMMAFDCETYTWNDSLQPADDAHKQSAVSWINQLQPEDATGTGPGMALALQLKQSMLYVLLTDGAPNCGAGDQSGDDQCIAAHLQMIDQANSQKAVINVFGIGASGDFRQFCVNIAAQNGGTYTDVR
jgi:von Willebrand factor type A domain